MNFNSSLDELSDVTSVNAPGLTLMANTALANALPKKRKSRAQPPSENSSKRPNTDVIPITSGEVLADGHPENQLTGPSAATDGNETADEMPTNRINYSAIVGEDPDGLISLAGLQAHLGKDVPGITGLNPVRNRTLQLYFSTLTNLLNVRESAFSDLSITFAVSNAILA